MKKVLFIDRDNTIIVEPRDNYQVDSFTKLEFVPGVITALASIVKQLPYELVMVTNQDGLGTASLPEAVFFPPHELMLKTLAGEGIRFSEVLIDRSFPHENSLSRKPRTGLIDHYRQEGIDLPGSFVIGDRQTDVELALNMGTQSIQLVASPQATLDTRATYTCASWQEILQLLRSLERRSHVVRTTRETSVEVKLSIDGSGTSNIQTGLGFFDHMLDQIGRHAGFDLTVIAKGDLHVDQHHTIEDTALALGEAIRKALNNMQGVERFASLLPMDEALAQIALDLSGRPYLVWDVELRRESVGDVPCEMFEHFFRSLVDQLRCTLNIKARGGNDHHVLESVFKGFARTLRQALKRDYDSTGLPSTKGVL